MRCPKCGADRPMVVATRRTKETTRRVRQCRVESCGWAWETIEVVLTDRVRLELREKKQLSFPVLQ